MKGTEIKGLLVEPADAGMGQGSVDDLILDSEERRVLALQLIWTGAPRPFVAPVEGIKSVDARAVVLEPLTNIIPLQDSPALIGKPTLNSLLEIEALNESGQVVGRLADVEVEVPEWTISSYDVRGDFAEAFYQGLHRVPVSEVRSGARSLTLTDRAIKEFGSDETA
ncbi:MAG: hypothetical protein ACRDFS_05470 [Chloroflexota bacterium]